MSFQTNHLTNILTHPEPNGFAPTQSRVFSRWTSEGSGRAVRIVGGEGAGVLHGVDRGPRSQPAPRALLARCHRNRLLFRPWLGGVWQDPPRVGGILTGGGGGRRTQDLGVQNLRPGMPTLFLLVPTKKRGFGEGEGVDPSFFWTFQGEEKSPWARGIAVAFALRVLGRNQNQ